PTGFPRDHRRRVTASARQAAAASTDQSICVLGLGYVGLTLAAAMADVGFTILGVEIRDDVLASLEQSKAHFYEPALDDKLARGKARGTLSFAKHVPHDWRGTVFIITVGTPLDASKKSRVDMIERVAAEVASVLKPGDLVVMRSTVKLGTTRT